MGRTKWTTEKRVAGSWVEEVDGVYAPNEAFERSNKSTLTVTRLANGKNAYMTFSTKATHQMLPFSWIFVDESFFTQIDDYVTNNDILRITDHLGRVYVGMFIDIKPMEVVGQNPTKFNIMANFEIMPDL